MREIIEHLHEILNDTGSYDDYPISATEWVRVVYLDYDIYAYARQSHAERMPFALGDLRQVAAYITAQLV